MSNQQEYAEALSELFSDDVSIEVLQQQDAFGAALAVVQMEYRVGEPSKGTSRIRQTAVLLRDAEMHLPQFALWPSRGGFSRGLLGNLMGMPDIDFTDSPEFSAAYHLHSWNEAATRVLFQAEVRDAFARTEGWSARGLRQWLVVYKEKYVCPEQQLDSFVSESLQLLEPLHRAEGVLDQHPEIERSLDLGQFSKQLESEGGLVSTLISKQLRRQQVTPGELQRFVAQPPPRSSIPPGLRRQVLGDSLFLVILGGFFCLFGIIFFLGILLSAAGNFDIVMLLFSVAFAAVGAGMLFFTLRFRQRKTRILHRGLVCEGRIAKVERTSVEVNGRRRYHLHLNYHVEGKACSAKANLYANVEKARDLSASDTPVRLLVDPQDPNRVLCLDTLLVFE
jgi:hypothetical protein